MAGATCWDGLSGFICMVLVMVASESGIEHIIESVMNRLEDGGFLAYDD